MEGKGISKTLSEENDELKQYIETLNKECMELQAVLFEEANKMAQTAYAAEHAAKRRADEVEKENSVLKKEVRSLKNTLRLHMEENPDVFAVRKSVPSLITPAMEDKPRSSSLRRLGFLRHSTSSMSSSATLPPSMASPSSNGRRHGSRHRYSSTTSNAICSTSVINVTSQEPVTRRSLLDALTSSTVCAETVAEGQFQEFLDWVDGGCCIAWPEPNSISKKQGCNSSASTFCTHDEGHDIGSKEDHCERTGHFRNDSDVDDTILAKEVHSNLPLPLPPSPMKDRAFFHRLVREDIAPALDFADAELCTAIQMALGRLGVEIEPLSSLSVSNPSTPIAPGTPKCPLVPTEPVKFSIKLETVDEDGTPMVVCFKISSWARQRIAAVADLFQYFSLIRRGLTGTPTTPNSRSPSNSLPSANRASLDSSADYDPLLEPVRRHQFENVQRRRLNITLSRLGYGLPSTE